MWHADILFFTSSPCPSFIHLFKPPECCFFSCQDFGQPMAGLTLDPFNSERCVIYASSGSLVIIDNISTARLSDDKGQRFTAGGGGTGGRVSAFVPAMPLFSPNAALICRRSASCLRLFRRSSPCPVLPARRAHCAPRLPASNFADGSSNHAKRRLHPSGAFRLAVSLW